MNHSPRLSALIIVSTLTLVACSSGGGGPAASNRPFAAYRQCLQQHGVTPRRSPANPGTTETTKPADPSAFAAARQACAGLRPAGGLRGGGIASKPRAAFRRCMTDHGVTLPAPGNPGSASGGTTPASVPRGGMLRGLDRNDPAVAKALTACRSLLVSPTTTTSTRP